jgi:branched-subunit amino acid permease
MVSLELIESFRFTHGRHPKCILDSCTLPIGPEYSIPRLDSLSFQSTINFLRNKGFRELMNGVYRNVIHLLSLPARFLVDLSSLELHSIYPDNL